MFSAAKVQIPGEKKGCGYSESCKMSVCWHGPLFESSFTTLAADMDVHAPFRFLASRGAGRAGTDATTHAIKGTLSEKTAQLV